MKSDNPLSNSSLQFSGVNNIAAGTTFFGLGNSAGAQIVSEIVPRDGVIHRFYAHSGSVAGAGETYTYTVMVNGVASALTSGHGGAALKDSSDLINRVVVSAGDLIEIRLVATGGAAAGRHSAAVEYLI